MFFVAFVLFIYPQLNIINLLFNAFSMFFLVVVTPIKGLCVIMQKLSFIFLGM